MRNTLIALGALLGVSAVALVILLTTNAGLRWAVDQVLARSDARIEVEHVDGRLLGPATLSGVAFRDAGTGTAIRVDHLQLDWRASALLRGLLHVTRLHASGIDYRQGTQGEAEAASDTPFSVPAVPLDVRIDRFSVESVALDTGGGAAPVRIQRASLQGAFDGESVLLAEMSLDAKRYALEAGRIRLGLGAPWSIEGRLDWSASPPDLAALAGSLKISGELGGNLEPHVKLHEPFAANLRGTVSGLFAGLHWSANAELPEGARLDHINSAWPGLLVQGAVRAQGDAAGARLRPDVSLTYGETTATLTGDLSVSPDELVVTEARLEKPDAADSIDFTGRMGFAKDLPFELQGTWQSLRGPQAAPWTSPSGELRVSGDVTGLDAMLSGTVAPPDGSEPSPVELDLEASGLDETPTIVGEARLPYFALAGAAATGLEADVDLHMAGDAPSSVRVSASTLAIGERRVTGVEARATGSIAEHGISLAGQFDEGALNASADGGYADGAWGGTLRELSLDSELPRLPGQWRLARPAELAWSPHETRVGELCVAQAPARVCAEARFAGAEQWSFDGRASGLPLRWLVVDSEQPVEIEGTLAASAGVANQGDGINGAGQVNIDRAMVRWQGDEPVTARYQELQLDASLDPAKLRLKVDGTMDDGGMIRGELTTADPLAHDGSIEGTLSAHLPSLRTFQGAVPQLDLAQGELQVEVSVAGRRSAPTFEGSVNIQEAALKDEALAGETGPRPPIRIQRASLQGTFDGEAVVVDELAIDTGRYAVAGSRIRLGTGAPWPLEGRLDWSAQPPELAPFAGSLSISGALEDELTPRLEVHRPFAASARGTVSGVLDRPRWTIEATVPEAVGLDRIRSDWPGLTVQGTLQAQGDTGQARLLPDVSLTFQQIPATLTGEISVSPHELVAEARLERPDAADAVDVSGRLELAGNRPFELHATWQSLRGPETAPWASPSGELRASGDVTGLSATLSGMVTPPDGAEPSPVELNIEASGLDEAPTIVGDARLPYFAYAGVAATELKAGVDFHMRDGESSEVRLSAATLAIGERQVTGVEARATGSIAEHGISLAGQFDEGALSASADGSYADGAWGGTLRELSLDSELPRLPGQWRLARPADVAWSPEETRVGELCLAQAPARVCAEARFAGAEQWSFDGHASGLPLRWLVVDSEQPVEVEGTLAASASVANQGDGINGAGQVNIDRAMVRWQGDEPVTTRYDGLQLDASLDPSTLQLSVDGSMDDGGMIRGELTTADPLAEDGSIEGTLSAHLPSLRVLQAAAPQVGLEQGELQIELSVAGRRSAPRFEGRADMRSASMEVAPLGIRLRDLAVSVQSDATRRLVLEANAMAGDGPLEANGFVEWPSGSDWRGEITLRGDEARLASLPRALIEGSPDLRVRMDDSGGTVDGRIKVTRADLTPDAGRPGVTLSDDFVVVDGDGEAEPATTNPMAWHTTVTIDLGDEVRFNGYGLTGRLTGSLDLDAPPHQPPRASGKIDIQDGQYTIYGRSFDIKRGRVVYAGGPLDNPGIDLQVDREVKDVKVSLSVSGSLVEPDLRLTSSPPMSETDRMSYLLLGRPASQASEAEAGLLLQAAASLVPGGAQGVPAYIQSTLGLDTLEVQSDTADTEGAAVVLGKYLSPRLYVSYVAGVQTAVNVFRVRYDLARHWLLRAESSVQGSGGDLLFTW